MRHGSLLAALVALSACGRLSFDERIGADADGDAVDAPSLDAEPVTIRLGGPGDDESVADVVLHHSAVDNNLGVHPDLHIDGINGDQSLIWFGVDEATDRTVLSAELHLAIFQFPPSTPVQMTASEIQEAWTEGTGDFEVGAASFLERTPGVPWATAGANAPGSRDPAVVASVMLPMASDVDFVLQLPPDLVNRWVTAPAENHGLALQMVGPQYVELYSSDHPALDRRPVLVLTVAP